jgi:pimeloyl-ACP methyl ester carboxylesterase
VPDVYGQWESAVLRRSSLKFGASGARQRREAVGPGFEKDPGMKTLLSSGIVGWLSLTLAACAGGDDSQAPLLPVLAPPATVEASVAPETPASTPANPPAPVPADDETTAPRLESPLPAAPVAPTELHWRACGEFDDHNLECAEVEVPVDYAQPDGEKLPIAVRRILASPLEPHHGALLFNPGGPGGEGIDSTLSFFKGGIFDQIAPGYDIVGFDPRGVGASGERGCGIAAPDLYPVKTTEQAAGAAADVQDLKDAGAACEKEWGPLFRKLGSNNVVRDIEEIRKALKEPLLNFYGGSYGTRLGALYAHDYPDTTGRIVLDAPVDPRASFVELVRGQFQEVVALHERLFVNCESGVITCPPGARDVFTQILANANQRGVQAAFVSAWRAGFESEAGVEGLIAALSAEAATPGGDWILSFIGSGGGGEADIGLVPFFSVSCTDDTVEPPTLEQIASVQAEFLQVSPLFADDARAVSACAGWPTTRDPVPLPTAPQARPLLVIGGTADIHTPYPWAQAMTEALGNATLLTSQHIGHGAVLLGSDCVRSAIRAYLTSGSLPASGAVCP